MSEYLPNSIVVSCIYHTVKDECFITSVDTIYLLEALVGIRFPVEEKNRIRRNLAGFKPETVRRTGESADFFQTIMQFGQPRPRNIEKVHSSFDCLTKSFALTTLAGCESVQVEASQKRSWQNTDKICTSYDPVMFDNELSALQSAIDLGVGVDEVDAS